MKDQITLEEMKQIEVGILKHFCDFCSNNNLSYFLSGGTLLGAAKYKGFIPWDDDIDVAMPRNDYDKFISSYIEDENYKLLSIETSEQYKYPYAKLIDNRTILIEKVWKNTPIGVFIDIFPIDNVSDYSIINYGWHLQIRVYYYCLKINEKIIYFFENHTLLQSLPTKGLHILSKFILLLFARAFRFYREKPTNNVSIVAMWQYRRKIIISQRKWYEKSTELVFERIKYRVPTYYDYILKNIYGDYMAPPPADKCKR